MIMIILWSLIPRGHHLVSSENWVVSKYIVGWLNAEITCNQYNIIRAEDGRGGKREREILIKKWVSEWMREGGREGWTEGESAWVHACVSECLKTKNYYYLLWNHVHFCSIFFPNVRLAVFPIDLPSYNKVGYQSHKDSSSLLWTSIIFY